MMVRALFRPSIGSMLMSRFPSLITFIAVGALTMFVPQSSVAQSACSIYETQPGDTLNSIARTARIAGGHQILFSANTDVITSLSALEVGTKLRIPCEDGSLPKHAVAESVPTAVLANRERPSRFLTGSDNAPFTDQDAREGGMFTEMVRRAMTLGAPEAEFKIIFVNDWNSHLTELLPYGAFDMGFPWFLPDCSQLSRLSASNQKRCTDFDASDPFFEAVVGYYAKAESPYQDAKSAGDLYGARLCRPESAFTFDLEALGLSSPNVALVRPSAQQDCWQLLLTGAVDVVTLEALPAEDDMTALRLTRTVKEIAALATVETMHVFSPKGRQNGRAEMAALNAGLAALRDTGEWYQIVATQMREHEARKNLTN